MELIVQPADGVKPLLQTIAAAQKSIDLMIFRFDLKPMEKELEGINLGEKRLENAQDIAWALLNSPAFLYNR